ncbi:MAG: CaiB/BaiF CoA-transferase family protein [Pseudomonadales bacterium]|nr:CaiB/BaiF CoA-transferase family protein [Pseudomonadales bacterium]
MSEESISTFPASNGPLAGVRIIDLSAVVSGPMAAVMLADQGAEVIKIEPPGWGDGVRGLGASRNGVSAIFTLINRNKKSVGLNLKHPQGRQLAEELIGTADVVLQNYRPGKMKRLGLDYDTLKLRFPELIYLSISGMGEVGPYSGQKVYDYVIQGMSGLLEAQGVQDPYAMVRTIIFDKVTALTAAQAMTAALFARERGAGGQHIALSMLDTAVYFNWADLMWNQSFEGEGAALAGDLADLYEVSATRDGAIVSHPLNGDCSTYSTEELIDLFAANEIPVGRVNRRDDLINDPQIQAAETLERFQHPRAGAMIQPRAPARFGATHHGANQPSPDVGEHTAAVLMSLGYSMDTLIEWAQEGAIG